MDEYERDFFDLEKDLSFLYIHTQKERHLANIARYVLRGHSGFVEGYGEISKLVDVVGLSITDIEVEDE